MRLARLLFLFLFTATMVNVGFSQIADGSDAPDWTATDLNGNVHDMSDILDQGYHVVLEFSATWCGPCWSYHSTGNLETLYDNYGPMGTNEIRVFYIEADLATNTACLYGPTGCNNTTQGNWVAGHDFPFIDLTATNASTMASDYQVGYYPTLYGVSGNTGTVWEVGQASVNEWENWLFNSFELQTAPILNHAVCPGEGSIDPNPSGGQGNLSYTWSTGANTPTINGLSSGTYYLTIEDANGYFIEEEFTLNGPANGPLSVNLLAAQDVDCNGNSTGALNVGGAGGNGGFSYLWSTGSTGAFLSNLPANTYSVTVTDVQGCTSVESYTVNEPEILLLSTGVVDADC